MFTRFATRDGQTDGHRIGRAYADVERQKCYLSNMLYRIVKVTVSLQLIVLQARRILQFVPTSAQDCSRNYIVIFS